MILVVNVLPLQSAALAPPHTGGDNQLEIGFVLDAFILQSLNQLLYRFLICDDLFPLFAGVFVGSPRRIVVEKTALHRIGEDAAQTGVQSLNSAFGERFSAGLIALLPHVSIEFAEVFRAEVGQFVVAQMRKDAGDILFVSCEGGFCQLVRCDFQEPEFNVLFQCDVLFDGLGCVFALHLKKYRLFLQPLFTLPFGQASRRLDRLLLLFPPVAVVIVAHRDDQQITVASLSDACHDVDLLSVDLNPTEVYFGKHNIPEVAVKSYCYFCSGDRFYKIDSYTVALLAQLSSVSKMLWASWFAASRFSRICGWQ
jgi:hypothetical protein